MGVGINTGHFLVGLLVNAEIKWQQRDGMLSHQGMV